MLKERVETWFDVVAHVYNKKPKAAIFCYIELYVMKNLSIYGTYKNT